MVPLSSEDIKPGLVISGFTRLEEFDVFENVLAQTMHGLLADQYYEYRRGVVAKRLSTILERSKPRRFWGKITDYRVILLPPDYSLATSQAKIREGSGISYLIERDLISNGYRRVGTLKTLCTMYIEDRKHSQWMAEAKPYVARGSRHLNRHEVINAVQFMNDDSRRRWEEIWTHGLQNAMSGGLPGLGKKS